MQTTPDVMNFIPRLILTLVAHARPPPSQAFTIRERIIGNDVHFWNGRDVFTSFATNRYTFFEVTCAISCLALKTEKPETKKGKRIADDDESWKPHTKKPKTATQSEKELAAEKQAYQIADHYEESHLEPPITNRMINSPFEPRIYTGGEHTHQIEDFLHIYISKQKDIVLVGIIHFYAKAPSIILKPGMKGIYLTVDQYRRLIDKRVSISNAIKQIKEDTEGKVAAKTHFDISKNKKVIVKSEFISWSQQVVVDIRDYSTPTEKCGEIPSSTDKAVTLTENQWNTLLSLHLKVIRDLADNFGYSEDFADELSA
ncbi:unnamed protein product [Mytilus coruscus]|uniref:Uncharacterized protein n=1 Tax=Mytilus coruscus TaxID=42192 RepID=A0A6J8CVH4_MYTCO|nr:unnamed protein product [Mytilus coruscus]